MPRQPARVEVLPLEPPEYIDVLEVSGLTSHFEIYLEHGTGKRRVQCDRCGLFMTVTSTGHPIFLIKHRDSDECKKEVRRNVKKLAKEAAQARASHAGASALETQLEVTQRLHLQLQPHVSCKK
jgi:hypothetical protein